MTGTAEVPTAVSVFDRVVVGVDGSVAALEAVRQAARLVSRNGALTAVSVANLGQAARTGFRAPAVADEMRRDAREALRRAQQEAGPHTCAQLLIGSAPSALQHELVRRQATLVAVGFRGHSRAAGILFEDVSTTLLHEAACSVLVARTPRLGTGFPSSILVGLDGSRESAAAALVAAELGERFGVAVGAVVATENTDVDVDAARTCVPDLELVDGHPVDALVAASVDADLLVVGSRGLHGLRALGSVSERVAHRAPSSVLVVRDRPG